MAVSLHNSLSPAQVEEFRDRGVIRLPGYLSPALARPVYREVADVLESAGALKDGDWVVPRPAGDADGWAVHSRYMKKLKPVMKRSEALAALSSPEVWSAARDLMGGRELTTFGDVPQLLFTAPNADAWTIPHKVWHMDMPRLGEVGCPGVQMFTFVDEVKPGSGATVVASGSHRFVNDDGYVRSKDVKKRLQKHEWFKLLFSAGDSGRVETLLSPTPDGEGEGVLQVVELTGVPGDVWLMDLRMLHSLAPNASDKPRLMATQRYALPGLSFGDQ